MANNCTHLHHCVECAKAYHCDFPECQTLTGYQRLCAKCGYLYGWARAKDKESNDWNSLT